MVAASFGGMAAAVVLVFLLVGVRETTGTALARAFVSAAAVALAEAPGACAGVSRLVGIAV